MSKYKFSYTAASFMLNEMVKIAEIYREQKNWDKAREIVLEENIIQKKTLASAKRMFGEFKLRISTLTEAELDLLVDGSYDDQVQLNFLAICKLYLFIQEFVVDVLRNKYLVFDTLMLEMDYLTFVEEREAVLPELEALADSTKGKLRRTLYLILREVGMLSDGERKIISPIILTDKVKEVVADDNSELLKIFLMSDSDITRSMKYEI